MSRRTTVTVMGKTSDVWVSPAGKGFTASGSVTFKAMGGNEVTKEIQEHGRSESAALRAWETTARVVMDY